MMNHFVSILKKNARINGLYKLLPFGIVIIFQLSIQWQSLKNERVISFIANDKRFTAIQPIHGTDACQLSAPFHYFKENLEGLRCGKTISTAPKAGFQNDSLQTALRKAALVIRGRVIQTDLPDSNVPQRISEHDPRWRKAIIDVKQVLKGTKIKKSIAVYYASSDDVQWQLSPKLKAGQSAIFLLQADSSLPFRKAGFYTVLNYLNVQKVETMQKIQQLLKVQH